MDFNITIIRVSLPLLKEYINQRGFLSLVVEHIIIINFTQPATKNWKYWKVNKTNSKFAMVNM